jgi:hypothetical protein
MAVDRVSVATPHIGWHWAICTKNPDRHLSVRVLPSLNVRLQAEKEEALEKQKRTLMAENSVALREQEARLQKAKTLEVRQVCPGVACHVYLFGSFVKTTMIIP